MDLEYIPVDERVEKRGENGAVLAQKNKADADAFALSVRPAMLAAMMKGSRRPTVVARKLNENGVPSSKGGKWYAQTVIRVLDRLGPEFVEEVLISRKANTSDKEKKFMAEATKEFGVVRE